MNWFRLSSRWYHVSYVAVFWKLPKHLVGSFKAAMMDHRHGDICQFAYHQYLSVAHHQKSEGKALHQLPDRSVLPRLSRLIIIATIVIIPASKGRTMTSYVALAQWTSSNIFSVRKRDSHYTQFLGTEEFSGYWIFFYHHSIKSFGDDFQDAVFKQCQFISAGLPLP